MLLIQNHWPWLLRHKYSFTWKYFTAKFIWKHLHFYKGNAWQDRKSLCQFILLFFKISLYIQPCKFLALILRLSMGIRSSRDNGRCSEEPNNGRPDAGHWEDKLRQFEERLRRFTCEDCKFAPINVCYHIAHVQTDHQH